MLDGEWAWRTGRPAGVGKYSFRLNGNVGVCTRTNAPAFFSVGQVMFVLTGVDGHLIRARQVFTNGVWYDLAGAVAGDSLHLSGGGMQWMLTRTTPSRTATRSWRRPGRPFPLDW